ncbi:hypothetical protein DXG03_001997 [Asterophora parasitica]|uniref:Nuclear pore protein n=1 Tax=Asterophora parasitica TaxID=117018 RepID=A0A9P7KGK0_9AGAR|nr:hypothetical protein DXG03_001997 [Asterophora parasitica]
MASDLSALLTSSKSLTSHLSRPDLPSVHLSLDQVEAQSRRLVSRQPGASTDPDRANYLLAQAHVDASALSNSIAHLNTSTTFSPLQPLQDTDVAGYLRHAHEQNLISTIEEGRKETQEEFYRALEERSQRDWEAKKKRVFEELGGRVGADSRALIDLKKSTAGSSSYGKNALVSSIAPSLSLQMQSKMMAYDRVITEFNAARLRGTSYPIVHSVLSASTAVDPDSRYTRITQIFHILTKITSEPPALPPIEHAGAHILNAPLFERKYARVYLGDPDSRDAALLRRQIARGAREALEEQYWDVLERTIQARPQEARLGGDPSIANKVRAFLFVRYYRNGEWEERIELVAGQPLWARLFFLVRTGHAEEALSEALRFQDAIQHRESSFLTHFKTWIESPERKLPKSHRDHLQSVYNAHMLHSATVDPFKLALYKLMGKLEPSRRNVANITTTTEDWIWFQLSTVDEDEEGGLRALADVLIGYGERHFEVPGSYAVSLSPASPPALSISTLIWRYVRQFVKMDAKEALQYVYCICLAADQGEVGKEQVENAWEQVRRIIVLGNGGTGWEELVGGYRPDGSRFSGVIEQGASLLHLKDNKQFNEHILTRAARHAEENDRIAEAIKLYNLAGDYATVVACLAQALSNTLSKPSPEEKDHALEKTAVDIIRHYERTNRAAGRERKAVVRLLRIREAKDALAAGKPEVAIDIMESTELIPLSGDVAKITRRAEEFKDLHEALQRNLQVYLPLTMEALAGVHQKVKASIVPDATRQMTLVAVRRKSRSLMIFGGILKYRMSPDIYSYLARLDVEIAL